MTGSVSYSFSLSAAHRTHKVVSGIAFRRSFGIFRPHCSQVVIVSDFIFSVFFFILFPNVHVHLITNSTLKTNYMDACIKFEQKLSAALLNESMTAGGIVRAINKQRRLHNLPLLNPATSLDTAAKIQARQMASTGQFGHDLENVKYPHLADRLHAAGHGDDRTGEVLFSGTDDSEAAVREWLNSNRHRKAILSPDAREIGSAVQYSKEGRPYVCALVSIPNKNMSQTIGDEIINIVKKYGKEAGKKLVTMAQSNRMKKIAPIIQKIVDALE
jgi:hypothetical protein